MGQRSRQLRTRAFHPPPGEKAALGKSSGKSGADSLKESLITCCRILDREGLLGMFGHVSVRIPGTQRFLINPGAGSDKAGLEPEDLLTVDFRGERVEGRGNLPMETVIHTAIHRAREDAVSVAHLHPAYATLSGIAMKPIRPVLLHGAAFTGGVPIYEKAQFIVTEEEGEELARFLGPRRAVILRAHGSVTVGRSLEEVLFLSLFLEENAKNQCLASLLGEPVPLSDEEAEGLIPQSLQESRFRKFWEYYARKAGRPP